MAVHHTRVTRLATVSDQQIVTEIERLQLTAGNAGRQQQTLPGSNGAPATLRRPAATGAPPRSTPPGAPGSFTVEAINHRGHPIASIQLTRELEIRLPAITDTRYPILRFLDEYGDTTLNTLQIRQLLIELHQLRAEVAEPAALQCIHALATIAQSAQAAGPHSELIFIGD